MGECLERLEKLTITANESYRPEERARARRVGELCEWIANHEGADIEILLASAGLHATHPGAGRTPEDAFAKKRAQSSLPALLTTCGYTEEEIRRILAVIDEAFVGVPFSPEAMILKDALALDTWGAVGILGGGSPEARALVALAATGEEIPPALWQNRPKMRTLAAEREALRRLKFMGQFLEQLRSELSPHETLEALIPPATPRVTGDAEGDALL